MKKQDRSTLIKMEKEYWAKQETFYDCRSDKDHQMVINFARLPAKMRGNLLELGCGSGATGQQVKKLYPDINIFGVDVSSKLLSFYKFHRVLADALYLPFKANTFDIIITPASLHHIGELERMIPIIFDLLKPGGFVFGFETNRYHWYRKLTYRGSFYSRLVGLISEESFYPDKFEQILLKNEFAEVKTKSITFEHKTPTLKGRFQSRIAKVKVPYILEKYINPSFLYRARKNI